MTTELLLTAAASLTTEYPAGRTWPLHHTAIRLSWWVDRVAREPLTRRDPRLWQRRVRAAEWVPPETVGTHIELRAYSPDRAGHRAARTGASQLMTSGR